MQIKYLGREKFNIKTKEADISLSGNAVSVNNFLFRGPGEYEKNGVFIEGIADNGNTIYIIHADDMSLCYLGKISHDLRDSEAKEIGDIDILFTPLGEDGSLNTKGAQSLVSKIDPRVVIPMLYTDLSEFKKSEGITDGEIDILKIKKDDLPVDERRNVILTVGQ